MTLIHLTFATLAAFRIIELFLADRITAKLRAKFPSYIWQCSRCLSVWAGLAVSLPIVASHWLWWTPFLNWPFALSWLYFVHNDWIVARRTATKGRQFVIQVKEGGQWHIPVNELNQEEIKQILQMATAPKPQQANGVATN